MNGGFRWTYLHALSFLQPIPIPASASGSGRVLFRSLVRTIFQTGVAPTVLRATTQEKGDPLCSAQSDALTQKTKGGARGPAKCPAEAIGRSKSGKRPVQQSVNCEKAQAIVSEFGFKEIKAEVCSGAIFHFSATRDGKPFSIQIEAANGELAKVQRHR